MYSIIIYFEELCLCCLMTPGLRKDIWCHVWPYYYLYLQITKSDMRPQVKWAVSLVIAHDDVNLSLEFKLVCLGQHTYFIAPEGNIFFKVYNNRVYS